MCIRDSLYYVPSGYAVAFPIKPSRDVGFGIAMIDYGDRDKDHTTLDIQEALEACDRALQSEMENWLNGKTYPNYGHEGICVPVFEIVESYSPVFAITRFPSHGSLL